MPIVTHRWVKRVLLALLLLLLILPAFQARLQFVPMEPLGGYEDLGSTAAPHPAFSWDSLYRVSYQPALERYVTKRIGFREWMIRLRNQFSYSILRMARVREVIRGRDQVLYERNTIDVCLGSDYMGAARVRHLVRRFRVVQDTLARRGKLLVFVAVPSKASYLPEYYPDYYQRQPRRTSNYTALAAEMRATGVNLLDLSAAFRQWKDTSRYPLFPRGGTHWSLYGAALAGDTLIKYLGHHYPHPLRRFTLHMDSVSSNTQSKDRDILNGLNLLWLPPAYRMAYVHATPEPLPPQQRRPNLLLIGDSFCQMLLHPFIDSTFNYTQSRFWYYNNEVYWPEGFQEPREVWKLDHKQQYLARDIIVVMFTEYNLNGFDKNFGNTAYNVFTPYSAHDSAVVRRMQAQLLQRPDLQDYWWQKNVETGRSTEVLALERAMVAYDSIRH